MSIEDYIRGGEGAKPDVIAALRRRGAMTMEELYACTGYKQEDGYLERAVKVLHEAKEIRMIGKSGNNLAIWGLNP